MQVSEDHLAVIERAVTGGQRGTEDAWRTASWSRCLRNYKLDPSRPELIQLEDAPIRHEREFFGHDLNIARQELEKTLAMIEGGGYSAQITNANGVIIDERASRDQTYYCSMDCVGSVWTEDVGGTNGIGTAIITEQVAPVYLADHFYAGMTGQACVGAPFFGPTGGLLGVINLSTRNPSLPKLVHRVVSGIAQVAAERLEQQYFRRHFGKFHTLHLEAENGPPCVLALDDDFRIVGASHRARERFRLTDESIGRKNLWVLFEKLRGEPTFAYLRENLRQLRPLGESEGMRSQLMQPQSALLKTPGVSMPMVVKKPSRLPAPAAGPTLAECSGSDPAMRRNVEILQRMAGSGLHVLLLGETGVGKDTLARAMHLESDRAGGPFVAFNCAAVPESLIDSELFGYSAGAFTGANRTGSPGRIVEADRGTLFLDEIGDMPLSLQTRLLRFLETREVTPLGGGRTRHVDVQVVAATHQDVVQRVSDGLFRQDLYYRLSGVAIHIPALRERKDMVEVVHSVLQRLPEAQGLKLASDAEARLLRHFWPGNIRELRNVLGRAARLASSGRITPDDLIFDQVIGGSRPLPPAPAPIRKPRERAAGTALIEAERAVLVKAIADAAGNADACAARLGCSRATLYRKLKAHGIALTSD